MILIWDPKGKRNKKMEFPSRIISGVKHVEANLIIKIWKGIVK